MTCRLLLPLGLLACSLLSLLAWAGRTQPSGPLLRGGSGNVRDYGAVGDGVADDTAAVQRAVESTAGAVFFPPGTYRLTRPVEIDLSRLGFRHVRGEGLPRVVMASAGPAFRFVGTHAGTARPSTVPDGVWAKERFPLIEGLEIVGAHEQADGVNAAGTMQLTICRLLVRRCRHGIHLTGRNRNVIISDCHVYDNRGVGVFLDAVNLHQINVTGCHISYCDGGGVVCRAGEVRNLHITGCDIENNQAEGRPPAANVLIDSTGGSTGEVAITGCTIQHMRQAAGSANIRVLGPAGRQVPGTDETREGHVVITGNVLSDTAINLHLAHVRGVVVTGNTFWTADQWNVLAEDSAYVTLGPNNFDRNPRYRAEETPRTTNALRFVRCRDCTLSGFTVAQARAAPAAVCLEDCDRFLVTGLSLLDCEPVGLLLRNVTRSRVASCLIRDDRPGTQSLSVRAAGGHDNQIVDNSFGRPHDIAPGIGVVERNFGPAAK